MCLMDYSFILFSYNYIKPVMPEELKYSKWTQSEGRMSNN